ncbi:MAG: hypothetical protein WCY71_08735 [Halothiobacillaceae bacterium]
MNKQTVQHYDRSKMRLSEARALLTSLISEEQVETLSPCVLLRALSGIEHLVESGERELDRMLDALRVGEVSSV